MKQAILSAVALAVQASASSRSIRGAKSSTSQRSDRKVGNVNVAASIHKMLRNDIGHTRYTSIGINSPVHKYYSIGHAKWRTLASEDFNDGMDLVDQGNHSVAQHERVQGRNGVARIKGSKGMWVSPSVAASTMELIGLYSNYKVIFSFQGLGIEDADSFCLDYTIDGGAIWTESRCWNSCEDFRNNVWYDDETVKFEAMDAARLSIRFRCNGVNDKDDILIDKVEIQAS